MADSATAPPEFRPLGIDGILVRFARSLSQAANARALAFRDAVAAAQLAGVGEIASSLVSVRVAFDPAQTSRARLLAQLQDIAATLPEDRPQPRRIWDIPVAFGPDHAPHLAQAADLAGKSVDDAIADITGTTVHVLAIGFAPGQPFLGMLPADWDLPRGTDLTHGVPRGALISAVRQLIIWAADAPTGWRQIGRSAFQVYRPHADDPFAFAAGDAVRFAQVADSDMKALLAAGDPDGGARCTVLH